jgi:rhodanese-related sulfurtransferase
MGLNWATASVILDTMIASVSPQQAQDLIALGQVEVVDVRDPAEWCGGHIDGARLVPLNQLRSNPKSELKRDGVIFVCAAGVRSQTAARIAAAEGFSHVYNLSGGTRAWVKAGLPLVNDIRVAV